MIKLKIYDLKPTCKYMYIHNSYIHNTYSYIIQLRFVGFRRKLCHLCHDSELVIAFIWSQLPSDIDLHEILENVLITMYQVTSLYVPHWTVPLAKRVTCDCKYINVGTVCTRLYTFKYDS